MAKLRGLGRGLDALLGEDHEQGKGGGAMVMLPCGSLKPGKYQPRLKIDDQSLEELAESIRSHGVLQPILVRPLAAGGHEIIAGERRWRAAAVAGLQEVPVIVREMDDQATLAVALIENLQREDLNVLEEAQGLQRLVHEFGLTHDQAAKAVGKSRSAVSNMLRLLDLSDSVRSLLMDDIIDMGHARALLPLTSEQQKEVALEIVDKRWSVREAEQRAKHVLHHGLGKAPAKVVHQDVETQRWETKIANHFGADVKLKANRNGKGCVSIHFDSLAQRDSILVKLDATRIEP